MFLKFAEIALKRLLWLAKKAQGNVDTAYSAYSLVAAYSFGALPLDKYCRNLSDPRDKRNPETIFLYFKATFHRDVQCKDQVLECGPLD